jgi:alanyl-tRNA synthetase
MLGNWSFGDYYKEEAIRWHWELITKVWEIDPKLLYATVHQDDKESEDIWLKMGVLPRDRILQFGDKDNFWEMGETGPCGRARKSASTAARPRVLQKQIMPARSVS